MQIVKPDVNINLVGFRRIAYIISAALILTSLITLVVHGGPKTGIDFAGGAEMLVKFDPPAAIETVKAGLKEINMDASVQQYGNGTGSDYRILISAEQAEREEKENISQMIQDALATTTQSQVSIEQFEMVGPQVGRDLREKALLAMFYALLFITVYISGRFELKWLISAGMAVALALAVYALKLVDLSIPWLMMAALVVTLILFYILNLKYAMGAVVALIHDVLITVGLFSLFDKEFTLPIIAALLTIIGYSLNDTIIVFDRIRENLRKYHREPLATIINKSVNETLNRTILTSLTTLIVVICLFVLGGGIIHDFAFALIVGVAVGTYSSVFVASPILLVWQQRK
jgi:preprotein translocase subunit SecF